MFIIVEVAKAGAISGTTSVALTSEEANAVTTTANVTLIKLIFFISLPLSKKCTVI
jgi:hypothetical protein